MRFTQLQDWLDWQEQLHSSEIDLGLRRVRKLAQRLGLLQPAPWVITVAGTNGKGSVAALLEALLTEAGYSNAVFSSPHLHRYNERIRIAGKPIDDQSLCDSFARIDQAREGLSLTYFEFGTLAALDLIGRSGVQVAILEVGLGGRLDAVNVVDCDCAVISSIGIDHVEWLGSDRELIGLEKAGVFRPGRPAVSAEVDPPASLRLAAGNLGLPLYQIGEDFGITRQQGGDWDWCLGKLQRNALPAPALQGPIQYHNAAAAVTVMAVTPGLRLPDRETIARAMAAVSLPGRCQVLSRSPELIVDVAHNPQAARAFAQALRGRGRRITHAVLGVLADKDHSGIMRAMMEQVDHWHLVDLAGTSQSAGYRGRAASLVQLRSDLLELNPDASVNSFDSVAQALDQVLTTAGVDERVVVMGSFLTVQAALGYNEQPGARKQSTQGH